ncbi:MAG: glycosyltransferase [Muribaculaceae bacterium]|nr:glycosyltransferase [Muribaculaceae bacterium]
MKVSIIVPVYNVEPYLRECLSSVIGQTRCGHDYEVILVDDGSTDASGAICDSTARSVNEARSDHMQGGSIAVRVIHSKNEGLSAARNKGIDAASGDYLTFVDSDDVISRDFVRRMLDKARPDTIVSCGFLRAEGLPDASRPRSGENDLSGKDSRKEHVYSSENAIERFLYQKRHICPSAWGHLIPRALFGDDLRFREGIIYEDLDLMYRLYERAARVVHMDAQMYMYRIRSGSIIETWNPKRRDVLEVTSRIEEHYARNPRLLAAARDRRMSAAFNIFVLNEKQGRGCDPALSRSCYEIIKNRRAGSLFNRHVRLKNKLGALASYLGPRFISMLAKL